MPINGHDLGPWVQNPNDRIFQFARVLSPNWKGKNADDTNSDESNTNESNTDESNTDESNKDESNTDDGEYPLVCRVCERHAQCANMATSA